jgi:hypothetical protein
MRILITHITRMRGQYICVAGIDPGTRKHVRPIANVQLDRNLLRKNGGVFEIGALVDLGPTRYVGRAPEVEDHKFSLSNLRFVRRVTPAELWECLAQTAAKSLGAIFGKDLKANGRGCTVALRSGDASLGHLQVARLPHFAVNQQDRVRIMISDGTFSPDLSVTDIRLYEKDHVKPRQDIVAAVAARFPKTQLVLAVGLSRQFQKTAAHHPATIYRSTTFTSKRILSASCLIFDEPAATRRFSRVRCGPFIDPCTRPSPIPFEP